MKASLLVAGSFAVIATSGIQTAAQAQGTIITGMVRSSRGDTLQGAQVRIGDLSVAAGTDRRGIYTIYLRGDQGRGQTVLVNVRALGYRPQGKTITLTSDTIRLHFMLDVDPDRAQERMVQLDTARGGKQLAFSVNRGDTVRVPTATADFSQNLYPPELIMQNQVRLRLTTAQRETILQEINRVQAVATQAQWRVAEETEKLNALLARDNVPEAQAIEQVRQLIDQETAVKEAQLSMLIRVRNVLTAEQRAMLRILRRDD